MTRGRPGGRRPNIQQKLAGADRVLFDFPLIEAPQLPVGLRFRLSYRGVFAMFGDSSPKIYNKKNTIQQQQTLDYLKPAHPVSTSRFPLLSFLFLVLLIPAAASLKHLSPPPQI